LLIQQLREKSKEYSKSGNTIGRDVLKTLVGELELISSKSGVEVNDEQVLTSLKKLYKRIEDTLTLLNKNPELHSATITKLEIEKAILFPFIPKTLSVEEILSELSKDLLEEILNALEKEAGKLIGKIMNYFRGNGKVVNGKDIQLVIKQLRDKSVG